MSNFMKYQYLAYNNAAVENNVIANQLKELSKGDLELDNPDELVSTNLLLKQIGTAQNVQRRNNNNNNNNKKKHNPTNQKRNNPKFKKQ